MIHGNFRRVISYHRRCNLRLNSSPRRHPFSGRSFLAGGVLDSGCGWCRRGPRLDGLDHGLAFPWFVSFMLINLSSCVGYHVMANMRIRLRIPAFFLFCRTISYPIFRVSGHALGKQKTRLLSPCLCRGLF